MTRISTSAEERLGGFSKDKTTLLKLLREEHSRQTNKLRPYPRSDSTVGARLPTSWAQQRLWFIDQLEGGSAAYHISTAMRIRGELDQDALRKALDTLVERHEILRTIFVSSEGGVKQEIAAKQRFALKVIDLRAYGEAERETQVRLQEIEEAHGKFVLSVSPLIRGRLLGVGSQDHVLLITMHHIISDAWSVGVLFRELGELYGAYRAGRSAPLAPLPIQYADYAYWQRQSPQGELLKEQLSYWRARLEGAAPQLELPTDRSRPAVQSYRGENLSVVLDAQLIANLRGLAHRQEMTPFMILCAGWVILLSRLSGQSDVVIGTPVANRQRPELERLIGCFVNTLVLRVEVRADMQLEEFLKQIKEVMLGAYDHQDVPFEQIVEALQPPRSLNRHPLFQVMLGLQNAPNHDLWLPGSTVTLEDRVDEPAMFDLLLSLEERGDEFVGSLNYATDLFDRKTVQRWMACFIVVLSGISDGVIARRRIGDQPILPENERQQVVELFNTTQVNYPQETLVHSLFEEQVERTPDAVAVVYEGQSLTYAELNCRANQLARYLISRGVRPDQLVAICVDRSLEMVVGLLGILKAGGAYVPLDPNYPIERLQYMLKNALPRVVLTQERLKNVLLSMATDVIALDDDWSEIAEWEDGNLDQHLLQLTSRHLAYVIYTSGSTGEPKGAMNEHRGVVNRLLWMQDRYGLDHNDRVLQKTPFTFDVSVWEFFWTLMSGARLIVARPQGHQDPTYLRALIEVAGVTTLHFVPSMLQSFLDQHEGGSCATVRHIVCSGEELPPGLQAKCFECLPDASLSNLYGPTEAAIDVTAWECRLEDRSSRVPIGRPISNIQIYVLEQHGQPVPIGVAGEIYIGGIGVGRGYLNRPELTAERFVADPFNIDQKARLYKTGDLGRWRFDGAIEYLGRNDHQVKIRGFRIELGEIEAQLLRHEDVKETVVVAREDVRGDKRLVAYVVADDTRLAEPAAETLRAHLKARLPDYMVPGAFVVLQYLPLTSSGKLDRRALPAPELGAYVTRQYEAPQGEVEEIVAGIWQGLLSLERVGRQDNFFELGGHSLLIVQMMERLRQVGLSADVRRVFESPTLADLASVLACEAVGEFVVPPNRIPPECETITPEMLPLVELDAEHIERIVQSVPGGAANIQDIYPLAPLQEGILFHHLLNEQGGDTYVLATLLSVSSRDRLEELIAALQGVIDRHDILRTAVLWEQLPQPLQVVHRQATLHVEEIVPDRNGDPTQQIQEWIRPERQRLDLRKAPLLKLQVAPDANGANWHALLQFHHIVCDHMTAEAVISEAVAYLEGRALQMPEPVPYRNHVAQSLAHARTHDAETFFRSKLGDIDEPTAPFGLLDVRGDGSRIHEACEECDATVARRVRTQARRLGVSAATLFHAAWGLVIARTSGRTDVVFGSLLLGRLQGSAGAKPILGMFINTLPLRLRLRDVTAADLVQQTQRELIQLLSHEQASLSVAQRCSGIVGSAPLFSALLNYRHSVPDPEADWAGARGIRVLASQERTNYPITLSVDDLGEGFTLTAQTDLRIEPRRMTGYLHAAVQSLVEALEQAPETPALALSILPESERQQVVESFNATHATYPQEKLIHELFEQQADRTPDLPAVVYEQRSLTYAELNVRANRLARHLRCHGVGRNRLVAICVGRNLDMVVGLLAILKAGAAYVPLDPNYPTDRLKYMLDDSVPQVVLTQQELKGTLPNTEAEVMAMDTHLKALSEYNGDNLSAAELELTSLDRVYVIYTSGSTGRPKGTEMPHRSMVNLIEWHRKSFGTSEGQRVLQFAALSFDVAFQETFSTLCTGGTLVLLNESVRTDPKALIEFLNSGQIHRLFAPPLMLQSLAEFCNTTRALPETLRDIITAGEQLRITPEITDLFGRLNACRLHNHYGPTETHVVTSLTLAEGPEQWPTLPTIGRPIANTKIYVLDDQRQPVPIGVTGEIYIGGAGIARGYLRRPELTVQRFVDDPFSGECGARLYRTGDLSRWRSDGTLEYLGRNDHQVKIRGFRIELGEIEAQLGLHDQVKDAVVIAREDTSGEKRLVAYVTQRDPCALSVEKLRAHVRAALPEHMVPGAFVLLESLPKTPNGKLDRRALPAPELAADASEDYEAPQGQVEEVLAEMWQELLRVKRVGRLDNFFELGGHSLHVMKLNVKVTERFMVRLSVPAVFKYPTLQLMGKVVESLRSLQEKQPSPEEIAFEEGLI
jgi:amino acid adenylation domain-containing protein